MHVDTSPSIPLVGVLGGLSLGCDGQRLVVPPGSRRLLAYLALHPGGVDRRVAAGAGSVSGWVLQDLDLRERAELLARLDPRGALFLGCRFAPGDERRLRDRGALVFPAVPDVPFDPYRSHLYTPDELYDGLADGG